MLLPPLEIPTRAGSEMVDVTGPVRAALRAAGVRSGVVVVYCPHTTAGVTIQENADPDVQRDLLLALANAVPADPVRGRFHHAEGNSDAHVKAALVGAAATVIVEEGELLLGTWQGIYLCEFDGPRARTLHVKVLSG